MRIDKILEILWKWGLSLLCQLAFGGILWLAIFISPLSASFSVSTVDSAGSVGEHTSIAIDRTGNPHIAYGPYSLKYAKWNGVSWDIETVDSSANWSIVFISLAIDIFGNPHISYYHISSDMNTRVLKYARRVGGSWSIETVDSDGWVGRYTSIAIDGVGNPHISYGDATNGRLKYAKWTGSSWIKQIVDSSSDVGWYNSLSLDGSGNPHIAYRRNSPSELRYASSTGSSWNIQIIDAENTTPDYTSIVLDDSGNPKISYGYLCKLKYARWTGTSWSTQTLFAPLGGPPVGCKHVSIALDGSGNPHMSNHVWDPDYDLEYVRWTGSSWTFTVPDSAGNVGQYTSIAIDGSGNPHISYFDATNQDLKYAKWTGTPFAAPMGGNARGKVQAPTNFRADSSEIWVTSITWRWTDNASNETEYRVYTSSAGAVNQQFSLSTTLGVNANNWTQTGLKANTSYQAYVAAVNASGVVTSSSTTKFTLADTPTGVTVTSVTASAVTLTWSGGNPSGTQFQVSRATESGFVTETMTNWAVMTSTAIQNLNPDTNYWFRVRARNNDGISTTFSLTVSTKTNPITTPLNPFFSSVSASSLTLTWTNVPGTSYNAVFSTSSNFVGAQTSSGVVSANTTGYTGLSPNVTFYFKVKISTESDLAYTSPISTVTLSNSPGVVSFRVFTTSVSVTLSPNGNPAGTIFRVLVSSAGFSSVAFSSQGAATTLTALGLQANRAYEIGIDALNFNNLPSSRTVVTNSTATLPAVPSSLAFTFVGNNAITITWDNNGNSLSPATSYQVQVSTWNGFAGIVTSSTTFALSMTTSSLTTGTTYFFRIFTFGVGGSTSAFSSVISTVTTVGIPNAPTNFTVTGISVNSITLGWTDASNNEDGFRILNSTGGILAFASANTTSLTLSGLNPNDLVQSAGISAYNPAGATTQTVTISSYTLANPPGTPSFTGGSLTSVSITWSPNSNPSTVIYEVSQSTDNFVFGAGISTPVAFSAGHTSTATTIGSLSSGKTYWFRVRARNSGGTVTSFSSAISTLMPTEQTPPSGETGQSTTTVTNQSTTTVVTLNSDSNTVAVDQPISNAGAIEKYDYNIPAGAVDPGETLIISAEPNPPPASAGVEMVGGAVVIVMGSGKSEFKKSVTFALSVNAAPLNSMLAGRSPSLVKCAFHNGVRWVIIPDSKLVGNKVEFTVNHLTKFAPVIAVPSANLSSVVVYPNPFIPGQNKITFDGLTQNATIKIYDVSGSLVKTITAGGTGSETWNGKNEDGEDVRMGLYIYVVSDSSGNKATGKIGVKR